MKIFKLHLIKEEHYRRSRSRYQENRLLHYLNNVLLHFDLEKINSLYSNLSSLTIWELYKLKKDYVDLGYSSIEINTQIQKIISFPLYVTLMTIIATIVMLNIKPNKSKVFYLVLGIALSVIIFYLSNFINILGKNERLPMMLAIWLPLIILSIFNMIGMVRLNEK